VSEETQPTARERFLAANKRKTKDVVIGDETFTLKEMTARQASPLFDMGESADKLDVMAEMIVASVYDSDGNLVFTPKDKTVVLDLGASMVAQLGIQVMELNGRAKPAVEEASKNSTAQESGLLSD
jgi:hypothetical protein